MFKAYLESVKALVLPLSLANLAIFIIGAIEGLPLLDCVVGQVFATAMAFFWVPLLMAPFLWLANEGIKMEKSGKR